MAETETVPTVSDFLKGVAGGNRRRGHSLSLKALVVSATAKGCDPAGVVAKIVQGFRRFLETLDSDKGPCILKLFEVYAGKDVKFLELVGSALTEEILRMLSAFDSIPDEERRHLEWDCKIEVPTTTAVLGWMFDNGKL